MLFFKDNFSLFLSRKTVQLLHKSWAQVKSFNAVHLHTAGGVKTKASEDCHYVDAHRKDSICVIVC